MSDTADERTVQSRRIERILTAIFHPKQFLVTFVYTDEGISFRVDDTSGNILGESYPPTSVREIESMSDGQIENRLKELLANTERFLS
jgi:hypothetical protein